MPSPVGPFRSPASPVRAVRLLVATAAVCLFLVGCGSDGDATGGESTTTQAAAPGATTTTVPAAIGLSLTSSAFDDDASMPDRFSCTGAGVSPPLTWSDLPEGTTSLGLLVVDPDAPVENGFTHWSLAGIDPQAGGVAEGEEPAGGEGQAWIPACPPSGEHRYVFTLYAFGEDGAPASGDRAAIEAAAASALGQSSLTGSYQKP